MRDKTRKDKQISRRRILPIFGSAFLLPFLGFSRSTTNSITDPNEEYQTLLKPDGTTVKVKLSSLKKSKILKKNISNKSFLNWLGRKL